MFQFPPSQSGRDALEIATEAARGGGEVLKARFQEKSEVRFKGKGNIVTDLDLQVENYLVSFLKAEYPESSFLCEESQELEGDSGFTWVIDPLDGTNNYVLGIPFFSVVLALVKGQQVLLGLVYDPIRQELFWARQGGGAFLNGSPISVSQKETIQSSIIGFDMGYDDDQARRLLKLISNIWPEIHTMRIMGSSALGMAYAACGRLDIYFHPWLYPWELDAGLALITEAGGQITAWDGAPLSLGQSAVLASNKTLHEGFLRLISANLGLD